MVSAHRELVRVPGRRLGWRPRDPKRPVLKLANYLTGALPAHPSSVDYYNRIPAWILGSNDRFGTCGPTSLANSLLLTSTWLSGTPIRVTDNDIFDLYRRSGNPSFNPATGEGDNGVDMTVMLSAAIQGGIGGFKPLAFALVNGNDPEETRAAGAIFGSNLWGMDLAVAQQTQKLWDYVSGSAEWGGHAVLAAGQYSNAAVATGNRTGLITWAEDLYSTDAFMSAQIQERYVVVWPWHLGTVAFQQGVNQAALAADYTAFTGRPFPVAPTPPAPTPTPTPTPTPPSPVPVVDAADRALVAATGPWAAQSWHPWTQNIANAINTWRRAKGL